MRRWLLISLLLLSVWGLRAQCSDTTSQGRDFWFSTPLQLTRSLGNCDVIAVCDTVATVTVYTFGHGYNQPSVYATVTVPADSATKILSYKYWPGPFHVVSTADVSLYVVFQGSYYTNVTNAIAPLFPSSAAGSRYVVQDYTDGYPYECHNVTTMVAMYDSTRVDFVLPSAADNNAGGYGTHTHYIANHPYTFYIRTGGVHELNAVTGGNLSGMEMVSDGRPFVLHQGYQNQSVTMSYSSALHMYEPLLPVEYWGLDFVMVTPEMEYGTVLARATALHDSTVLWLDGQAVDTLAALSTAQMTLSPDSAYRLRASGPVEVYLYLVNGGFSSLVQDPEQVLMPSVYQGLAEQTFYVMGSPYSPRQQLQVVAQSADTAGIALNGTPIGAQFVPLDNEYSFCRIDIAPGVHHLTASQGTFICHVIGHPSTDTAGIGFVHRSDKGFAYLTGMSFRSWQSLNVVSHVADMLPDGVRICIGDTLEARISTASEDTTAQWFADGVAIVGEQGLTIRHLFAEAGWHTLEAVVQGRICDTLRCRILVDAAYADTMSVVLCDGMSYLWHDSIYTQEGCYNWGPGLLDGCDSIETLQVTVEQVALLQQRDTFCPNDPYVWRGLSLTMPGNYVDTIHTTGGCDTVMQLQLDVLPQPQVSIGVTNDCAHYQLAATGDSAHFRWLALPADPSIVGHETEPILDVSPLQTTRYTLTADYSPLFDCPVSASVSLSPLPEIHANMIVAPQELTFDIMQLTASDVTDGAHQRAWYIDGAYVGSDSLLVATADMWADTLHLMLVVDRNGCTDTAHAAIPVVRSSVWAPNVFTPYHDENNRFRPSGEGILEGELYIFRRNGLLIAHYDDYTTGWDGLCHGKRCAQETYVWVLFYSTADRPGRQKLVGTITLLY